MTILTEKVGIESSLGKHSPAGKSAVGTTHHAHVMEPSNPRWEELLLVRDYLRHHPDVVQAYGNLKKALALVFEDDIAGFRDAKSPFVRAVPARAQAEKGAARASGSI